MKSFLIVRYFASWSHFSPWECFALLDHFYIFFFPLAFPTQILLSSPNFRPKILSVSLTIHTHVPVFRLSVFYYLLQQPYWNSFLSNGKFDINFRKSPEPKFNRIDMKDWNFARNVNRVFNFRRLAQFSNSNSVGTQMSKPTEWLVSLRSNSFSNSCEQLLWA